MTHPELGRSLPLPDLTLPQGSTQTLRRVLAAQWTRTWRDLLRIPLWAVAPHNRALYQRTIAALQAEAQRDPRRPLQVLRNPTISTLIHCIRGQLHAGGDGLAVNRWLREACALIWLELATLGWLQAPIELGPDADGQLVVLRSPALNLEVTPSVGAQGYQITADTLRIRSQSGEQLVPLRQVTACDGPLARITRPYHEIVPGMWLACTDNNPLAAFEAHPDKDGNRLDLGDQPLDAWLSALRWSVALVDRHLPLLGEELRLLLRLVVPVGWHAERHLSASYQEAIGLIYLTLHPQPMTMAEALVHEFQHNKINAVFHLDPLLHNAWQPRYSSPVRPDPRPLHGVILAVHAFQPVAQLYAAMADAGHELAAHAFWNERFRRILQLDRQGAATVLAHAQPTTVGAAFFAEMRQVDTALAQLEAQRWGDDRQMGGDLDELAGHD
jgi:HEXXH motif-containing protein